MTGSGMVTWRTPNITGPQGAYAWALHHWEQINGNVSNHAARVKTDIPTCDMLGGRKRASLPVSKWVTAGACPWLADGPVPLR